MPEKGAGPLPRVGPRQTREFGSPTVSRETLSRVGVLAPDGRLENGDGSLEDFESAAGVSLADPKVAVS